MDFFVLLHQRCAGKTDKQRLWQQALHSPMQLAGLSSVALIDKHKQLPLGAEVEGKLRRISGNKIIRAAIIFVIRLAFWRATELVYQRADKPRVMGIQTGHQIGTAFWCAGSPPPH